MADASDTSITAAKLAVAAKRLRQQGGAQDALASEPIAVIGIGCRFAENIESPHQLWEFLCRGGDGVVEVPADRWDSGDYFSTDSNQRGKTNSRWGSFVENEDTFDPVFFGISPREAASIDPQSRILLEAVWNALWDAGQAPHLLAGSDSGVFVAAYNGDHSRYVHSDTSEIGPHTCAGAAHSMASGRVSYLLDLRGPSISVDTACSSSLVSIHLACQSLRTGECNLAISGGVSLKLGPEHYLSLAKLGMLSSVGRCKTFDKDADGFVPGEGCGIVVLKRLADALTDRDPIRAVIRGTALCQDGRTTVITAPNGLAQQSVIRRALENGRVSPGQIGFVETHGTGTALGDPIELDALAEALGSKTGPKCALGALKTNLGHLEAAAGVAGFIKAVLALQYEEIPPNLHYKELNPNIDLTGTRFFVPTERLPWLRAEQPRFAAVSAFGFSGTNAHVVIEEAPQVASRNNKATDTDGPNLLILSARDRKSLMESARSYEQFLGGTSSSWQDVAYTAACRRTHYEERLAIAATSKQAAVDLLSGFAIDQKLAGVARGRTGAWSDDIVFVFSGQGSQWARMGWSLLESELVFRDAILECESLFTAHFDWLLTDVLAADSVSTLLNDTSYAQPAIFAVQVGLARLWDSWGIKPAGVIGHSSGEVAAAYVSGTVSLLEAVRIISARGRCMRQATGQGRMLMVSAAEAAVRRKISAYGTAVSLAAVNGPKSTVVAGSPSSIDELASLFAREGVECRPMPVQYAFHSSQMDPCRSDLVTSLGVVEVDTPTIPWYSTVTGRSMSAQDVNAEYWGHNVRECVRFSQAMELVKANGSCTFLEVGPHPVLGVAMKQLLADSQDVIHASLRRGQNERASLLATLGELHVKGYKIRWEAVHGRRTCVSLPAYPWQRQTYRIPSAQTSYAHVSKSRATPESNRESFPGKRISSPAISQIIYEIELSCARFEHLSGHVVAGTPILPFAGFLELVASALVGLGRSNACVEDMVVHTRLQVPLTEAVRVQLVLDKEDFSVYSYAGDEWVRHASGRVIDAERHLRLELQTEITAAVDVDSFYAVLAARGIPFGESFRTVLNAERADNYATAVIRLGAGSTASPGSLHTTLLDGCFQTAMIAAGEVDGVFLPIGMERYRCIAPATDVVRCYTRVRSTSGSTEVITADMTVVDATGAFVADIQGLQFKRFSGAISSLLHSMRWVEAPRQSESKSSQLRGVVTLGFAPEDFLEKLSQASSSSLSRNDSGPMNAVDGEASTVVFFAASSDSCEWTDISKILKDNCSGLLNSVQSVGSRTAMPRLLVVTRGAQMVGEEQATFSIAETPLWGMARSIASELPGLRCVRIDLDPAGTSLNDLIDEMIHPDGEDQIAYRDGKRFVARLTRHKVDADSDSRTPRRLVVRSRGMLDNLALESMERRAPAPEEVEIEVEASALNFRDVLNALGMYPGDPGPLGLECSGRVSRVGSNVTKLKAGDEVIAVAWASFSDYAVTPADLVVKRPALLGAEDAATLPNVFLTAHYALNTVGRMKAGDRVLIHAGTGGVGLAAVQLAQRAGAEVIATVGSDVKRAYLQSLGVKHIFHSRTLDFAAQIRELTNDKGVDIVLNSLNGEFIDASFSVLGDGGRFLELGKIGIWSVEQARALGRGIEYTVIDLGEVIASDSKIIERHLTEIADWVTAGELKPLSKRVFELTEAVNAFRYMAQAKHIGKVILRHRQRAAIVRGDGTYLITGGLGGLGLQVARWLGEQGARNVMLTGRSAASQEAETAIEELRQVGVNVQMRQADISRREDVERLLSDIDETMPPLRGVMHAAGVLDDGVVLQQSWERYEKVMAPKVAGSWHLHELTAGKPLDFFVLFSSIASLMGSPGQSNYAAANAFLDGLAHYRKLQGLPALSINWGAWADVGMAARLQQSGGRTLSLRSIREMKTKTCLTALAGVLRLPDAQLAVADISVSAGKPLQPGNADKTEHEVPTVNLAVQLAAAPASNRRKLIVDLVRQQATHVLGLPVSHIVDERQPLLDLGLDSLMSVELRSTIAMAVGRPLSATLLFDYPTLRSLADYLLNLLFGNEPVAASRDMVFEEIQALTDADAEALLEAELQGFKSAHAG